MALFREIIQTIQMRLIRSTLYNVPYLMMSATLYRPLVRFMEYIKFLTICQLDTIASSQLLWLG